jgi:biotin carboxyl carrier protein
VRLLTESKLPNKKVKTMKEYKYKINGNSYKVTIGDIEDNIAHVEVNGTPYNVEMEKAPKTTSKPVVRPAAPVASTTPAPAPAQVVKPAAPSTGKSGVKSPLPGVILDIKVNVGDTVKKGQTIIILEAMKMENNINADKDGKITAINVSKGDSVLEGNDLVIIE